MNVKMCERHRVWELRHEWLSAIRWCYVSGGKAVHAFLPGEDVPICGQRALRGPEDGRRDPRWRQWSSGMTPPVVSLFSWSRTVRYRHQHQRCALLIRERLNELPI